MAGVELIFEMLGYWHMGSGMGQGGSLDALAIRMNDLPYIPGRTVKGLLRDGVLTLEECGQLVPGTTEKWFGTDPGNHKNRYDTDQGCIKFTNASLGKEYEIWSHTHHHHLAALFHQVSSTALDAKGNAVNKSLRRIEVAVPMTLTALAASNGEDTAWVSAFAKASYLIRYIGSHRHRGLGRVKLTVKEVKA